MGYQRWLPQAIVDAGLRLSTEPGWETRGSINLSPRCVVAHHTGAIPDITAMLRDGRAGLPGPLCNVELRRSGECRVIAAGRANQAGAGGYRGLAGNSSTLGIEASSDGKSWTQAQREVYPVLCAALAEGIGVGREWIIRHQDWAPTRKWDAGAWTTAALRAGRTKDQDDQEDDDMATIIRVRNSPHHYIDAGGAISHLSEPADIDSWKQAGAKTVTVSQASFDRMVERTPRQDVVNTKLDQIADAVRAK